MTKLNNETCFCAENFYDEPSLPDPSFQQLSINTPSQSELEMMENSSYIASRIIADSRMVFEECPAYIRHQDVH